MSTTWGYSLQSSRVQPIPYSSMFGRGRAVLCAFPTPLSNFIFSMAGDPYTIRGITVLNIRFAYGFPLLARLREIRLC